MGTRSRLLGVLALALGGCGDNSADDTQAPVDASAPVDVAFTVGPHEPLPIVPSLSTSLLHHPAVVTVTFAGDPRRAQRESFAQWIVTSKWLAAAGSEYGIGSGTVAGAVSLPMTPPAMQTFDDIGSMLAKGITDGSIPKPATGLGDALYLVYCPATTTINARSICGQVATSCTEWEAYHHDAHVMGLDFAYAVLPDCGHSIAINEDAASHELIEAATNPVPSVTPNYQLKVDATDPWFAYFGSCEVEVGDLCETPSADITESGHTAQRSWSNAAAAANQDPCVPADPKLPYFNTSAIPTAIQHVAPGGSVTYTLHGWSLTPIAPWSVYAGVEGSLGSKATLAATATLSSHQMSNGGTSTLTVTVPADAKAGTSASIVLYSKRSLSDYHIWVLGVTTP